MLLFIFAAAIISAGAVHDDVIKELDVLRAEIDDLKTLSLEGDAKEDADVKEITKELNWYMKKKLADRVLKEFKDKKTDKITVDSWDKIITAAGDLVEEHQKDCANITQYCHEQCKVLKRASDVSWKMWVADGLGMVKGAIAEIFAEKAGLPKGETALNAREFFTALNNMERASEDEIAAITALLQYFFKYKLVEGVMGWKTSFNDDDFKSLLKEADELIEQENPTGVKKSTDISWTMWIGRSLGMVGPAVKKSMSEGTACEDHGHLTKDCFFEAILNT